MRSSRWLALAGTATLTLAVSVAGQAAHGAGYPGACTAPPADAQSLHDIDHDTHREGDVAIGVPLAGPGAVDITYDPQCALHRQRVTQAHFTGLPAPGAHDAFGYSVAYINLPGDENADLAIGAPGSDGGRGAVVLALGSADGLAQDGAIRLTGRTPGEHFGAAIAKSGADLFVGAPDRTVAGHARAGAVDHYSSPGTARSTSSTPSRRTPPVSPASLRRTTGSAVGSRNSAATCSSAILTKRSAPRVPPAP